MVVCCFSSLPRISTHIYYRWLQIDAYDWHLWPLSSKSTLAFHTYHNWGQPFLRWYGTPCNIFKDDRILKNYYNHGFKNFKIYNICPRMHLLNSIHVWGFGCGIALTCFNELGMSRTWFEHQTFRIRGKRSTRLSHRRGWSVMNHQAT